MWRTGAIWTASTALALGMALAATGAAAPQGQPGGLSPQSNGPIDITADNGTYDNASCESTWTGSAEVLQGTTRLRAHEIRAFMKRKASTAADQSNCGAAERIEADGDVYYVTPDQNARGDHAVYNADANLIVMTGDVILVQGKNVVHGDRLTIHTQTRAAQMESGAQGRGTPGRVRAVFYQSQQPGAPPGAPAASH